mgnify:CR=1 FL=1
MYRVFMCDDEMWILLSLKNLIDWQEEGFFICGEATDGIKAWERIRNLKPDLIFSDIRMPGMDGIELVKKVREEGIQAEIIIISGYSEFQYAKAAMQYGCSDYLLKPIDEEELLDCIRRVRQRLAEKNPEETEKNSEAEMGLSSSEDGYRSDARILKEMQKFMQENYKTVTQQQLADRFHMSISAVSLLFKRKAGKTYSDFLLEIRINKAEDLLRRTNASVEEIAEQVGYNDYFYFLKIFKKATGISPTVFRKNLT